MMYGLVSVGLLLVCGLHKATLFVVIQDEGVGVTVWHFRLRYVLLSSPSAFLRIAVLVNNFEVSEAVSVSS